MSLENKASNIHRSGWPLDYLLATKISQGTMQTISREESVIKKSRLLIELVRSMAEADYLVCGLPVEV